MTILSFIITTYNTKQKYVDQLFNSFGSLINDDKIEFIIVDDCSLDKSSFNFAKQKYNSFKNFKFFELKENSKRAGAFIKGISMTTGKYICSLDSDDFVNGKKVIKLLSFLEKNNYDFLAFPSKAYINKNGKIIKKTRNFFQLKSGNLKRTRKKWSPFAAYNTIYSGEIARKLKYDKNIRGPHDDAYFASLNFLNSKNIYFLKLNWFCRRIDNNNDHFSGAKAVAKNIENHYFLLKIILNDIKTSDNKSDLKILNFHSTFYSHLTGLVYQLTNQEKLQKNKQTLEIVKNLIKQLEKDNLNFFEVTQNKMWKKLLFYKKFKRIK